MRDGMRKTSEPRVARDALAIGCLVAGVWIGGAVLMAQGTEEKMAAAKGRTSYNRYCRSCHGEWGKGDGSVAKVLKVPPADLTAIARRNGGEFPFDDVFRTIDGRKEVASHGPRDMPVWGDVFKESAEMKEEQVIEKVAELAYYVKSIQEPAER